MRRVSIRVVNQTHFCEFLESPTQLLQQITFISGLKLRCAIYLPTIRPISSNRKKILRSNHRWRSKSWASSSTWRSACFSRNPAWALTSSTRSSNPADAHCLPPLCRHLPASISPTKRNRFCRKSQARHDKATDMFTLWSERKRSLKTNFVEKYVTWRKSVQPCVRAAFAPLVVSAA